MRDILFKAKRLDNGKWVQGDLVRTFERYGVHAFIWVRDDSEYLGVKEFEVDPETVCQYTGFTDKNGVKIFENDVVTCWTLYQMYCESVVKWDKENAKFVLEGMDKNLSGRCAMRGDYGYTVIRNIHDKKECKE